jgi:pilus assembly protein TadC
MGEQQQDHGPVYNAHEPSQASKRINAMFDDMESKQLDTLNDAGKSLIERIATFLGVLFGLSILNSSFPPSYLKSNTPVKIFLIAALISYMLAIGASLWATQIRFYQRYTYNVTRSQNELVDMIRHKIVWLRLANLLFASGTVLLAVLLILIVWNL